MEPQLPSRVGHFLRHADVELQTQLAEALRHVTEAGCDLGCAYDIGSHHLPCFIIPYGIHYYGALLAAAVAHYRIDDLLPLLFVFLLGRQGKRQSAGRQRAAGIATRRAMEHTQEHKEQ